MTRRRARFDAETAAWRLEAPRLLWLIAASTLVLVPHALRIPFWISAAFVVLVGWRLLAVLRGLPLPSRWFLSAFALAFVPGVWLSFGTVLGRDAGVAMLVFLAGMKLLETRTLRDAYVVCFLGYFLIITNFLYSQSMLMGVYMVLVVLVTTSTLVVLNGDDEHARVRQRLRVGAVLLLQAIPVALVLFVLFPRIPGPLWGLPKDAFAGVTGLSDAMSPGSISSLSQSDAVAFRVRFDGPPPASSELYWRGPVLWDTDGRRWSGEQRVRAGLPPEARTGGTPVDYTVTLEPHQQRWLFALELPVRVPDGARLTRDFQLLARQAVRERRRYSVRSYLQHELRGLSPAERERALALPVGKHPKARRLAADWRAAARDDAEIVRRGLAYFTEQPFFYTLKPPLLGGDTVDEFLFLSRRGFCEHFAAAFTVLMRAAGVPTRIVTGYQGGEPNALGDYLVVRQRDAHAWTEVWLEDRGWVRVDPTAAVSPTRIEQGMTAALPESEGAVAALALEAGLPLRDALRGLRDALDTVSNGWNEWVLGYGPQRQRELLANIGLDANDWRRLGLVLLVALMITLTLVTAWLLRPRRQLDRAAREYARLCRKLARAGLARAPNEGPVDYAERVARERPELAAAVANAIERYVALRYAPRGGDLRALRDAVSALRV